MRPLAVLVVAFTLGVTAVTAQERVVLPWVQVPAGRFQMGCVPADGACLDHEYPRHAVTISRPFDLMATEVTVTQYAQFGRATGYPPPRRPDFRQEQDHPIVLVSWNDASAFCEWAGGRLPTEAEWEYAARAGRDATIYGWGDELSRERANFGTEECCRGAVARGDRWFNTAPVGSLPANDFGLYDMVGNVWEWVADWYGDYPSEAAADPRGADSGAGRVARGGSWLNFPAALRVSVRLMFAQAGQTSNIGTRCARDVAPIEIAE